ncbi:MAG: radical SAM protein [Thermoguttaceae bacterium]|jgi:radical SAM superfamily enzyme YgiQ (UPF0313 family)
MRVVLWDTRKLDVSKDFAGGFGIGQYPGHGGLRGRIIRRFFKRDYRPAALLFAYLAAVFSRLGHRVEYAEDRLPTDADLYVFFPALITLPLERQKIQWLLAQNPAARVLVVGTVASVLPEAFADLGVTVVKGEAEQLFWRLDEVLAQKGATVQLGVLEDLDRLPMPDWSPFEPHRFRIGYDFWQFPTALIQSSRGCTFKCNYCPYIILENSTRFRSPEAVVDEIRYDIAHWGFRSFKFRDPLFGLKRQNVFELADRIGRLPQKIQFSIETRLDIQTPEILRLLKRVGLTSITVGIETPSDETLLRYHRALIREDRQVEFVALCRSLGIRTVGGYMVGFPDDTEESVRRVWEYAIRVGTTFGNFNVVTPYPGTAFYDEIRDQIADFDTSRYTVYTPVLKYKHLTAERMTALLAKCFNRYYFRWPYLRDNVHLLWPWLQKLGIGSRRMAAAAPIAADGSVTGTPKPHAGAKDLNCGTRRADGPHQSRDH